MLVNLLVCWSVNYMEEVCKLLNKIGILEVKLVTSAVLISEGLK